MNLEELAKIKRLYEKSNEEMKKSIEEEFPEMFDNENETIRKELIGMVKFHCADENLERYLNYLEGVKGEKRPYFDGYFKGRYDEAHSEPDSQYQRGFEAGKEVVIEHPEDFGLSDVKLIPEPVPGNPVELDDDTLTALDRALGIIVSAKGKLYGYQSDDGIFECDDAIRVIRKIMNNGLKTRKVDERSEKPVKKVQSLAPIFTNEFGKQVANLIASVVNGEYEYNDDFLVWAVSSLLNYARREVCTYEQKSHAMSREFCLRADLMEYFTEMVGDGVNSIKGHSLKEITDYFEAYHTAYKPTNEQMSALYKLLFKDEEFTDEDKQLVFDLKHDLDRL